MVRIRCVRAWRARGALDPRTGPITFVQRFGGLVNLNVHFHIVTPDSVFVDDDHVRSRS